ncbi:MAG: hypothetical protein H6945_09790 [Zoogloeaceae bacterium]|nr:hypothetical protein [Rhodocyclaceae bacterium]MCP5236015.1 hypothetical protein [Zoogloeaceae bacterium]
MTAKPTSEAVTQQGAARQWVRLVAAYLLVPLVLLLCAGELARWPAWLYSLLFLAAGIGGRICAERRQPVSRKLEKTP